MVYMEQITYPGNTTIGRVVDRAIKATGLSQSQVAIKVGISPNTLNRRINGQPFRWDELRGVAEVVGRTASSLIAEAEIEEARAKSTAEVA